MDLASLVLVLIAISYGLVRVHRAVGGMLGVLHSRVREPLVAATGAVVLFLLGYWLIGGAGSGPGGVDWGGMGMLLVALAVVILFIAAAFLGEDLNARREEVGRIADELDLLLDPTDTHFVVDASNAHRPLDLLEELAQLIGPGRYAPGHPWATHQWIADRMAAARAVKPAEASPRIDSATS